MVQFYESIKQLLIRPFPLSLPDTKNISYEELKALLGKSENLLLVDVRGKEEMDKGRIPGSVHIPGELPLNSFTRRGKGLSKVKIHTVCTIVTH